MIAEAELEAARDSWDVSRGQIPFQARWALAESKIRNGGAIKGKEAVELLQDLLRTPVSVERTLTLKRSLGLALLQAGEAEEAVSLSGRLLEECGQNRQTASGSKFYKAAEASTRYMLKEFTARGQCSVVGTLYSQLENRNLTTAEDVLEYARCVGPYGDRKHLKKEIFQSLNSPDILPRTRRSMLYVLASIHESLEEFDLAWESAREANRMSRQLLAQQTGKPDGGAVTRLQSLKDAVFDFTSKSLPAAAEACPANFSIVFIFGFPRSGTTLIDQVLAAHPRVYSAGERSPLIFASRELREQAERKGLAAREFLQTFDSDFIGNITKSLAERLVDSMNPNKDVYVSKVNLDITLAWLVPTLFPNRFNS